MAARKCPSCGGENLKIGRFAHGGHCRGVLFEHEPRPFFSIWGTGLRPTPHACRDCGNVSLFLDDEDRGKLSEQEHDRQHW